MYLKTPCDLVPDGTWRSAASRFHRGCPWVAALVLLMLAGCRWPGRDGQLSPDLVNSRQLSQQAQCAMDRNRWDDAEKLLADAVKTCPSDAEARRLYADALWQRGAHTEALAQLDEAMRLGTDETAFVRATELRLAAGQVNESRAIADVSIDRTPQDPTAWAARARVLRQAGDLQQALADGQRALSYDPSNREVLLEVAEIYRELGQPQRALVNLHALADSYPPGEEPQQVLLLEAAACKALKRYDQAIETLVIARDRGPVTPQLLGNLADVQLLAGHSEAARLTAEAGLRLDPHHATCRMIHEQISLAGQPALRR